MNIETQHMRFGVMQMGTTDGAPAVITIHPGATQNRYVIEVHTCEYSLACRADAVTLLKLRALSDNKTPMCAKHAAVVTS